MAISTPTRHGIPALSKLVPHRTAGPVTRSPVERLWILGGTVAGLLLVLIGYFLLIGPQRSTTSSVRQQVTDARGQQQSLRNRISALRASSTNLARYEAQLAAAHAALPSGTGVSDLLRELQATGAATSTSVTSVAVGTPTAVVPATSATAGATATPTTSPTTSTTAAAGTPVAASGLYSMTVSASVSGSQAALGRFLQQLQQVQPRAVLITQLTLGNSAASGGKSAASSTLSLSMLAFMTSSGDTQTSTP